MSYIVQHHLWKCKFSIFWSDFFSHQRMCPGTILDISGATGPFTASCTTLNALVKVASKEVTIEPKRSHLRNECLLEPALRRWLLRLFLRSTSLSFCGEMSVPGVNWILQFRPDHDQSASDISTKKRKANANYILLQFP